MLEKLWKSLLAWDTDDAFCCADREKKRPESGGRPPVPQAKPRQSAKAEEVAGEGGEPPPRGTEGPARADAPAEEDPAAVADDASNEHRRSRGSLRRRASRRGSDMSLEGGSRLPQRLPGYYEAHFGSKAEEGSEADSTSSDEDFDRELAEAGRAMKVALNIARHQTGNDDQGIVRRIDTALHDIVPDSMEDSGAGQRLQRQRHRKGSKQPSRAQQRPQGAVAATKAKDVVGGDAEVRQAARYAGLKEQLRQEGRVWGPPPDTNDPRAARELQRYREAMGARFEQLRPGRSEAPITGTSAADAVRESVRRYHQHCEAVGRTQTLAAGGAGVELDNHERDKLAMRISILGDEIPDAVPTSKSIESMGHTISTPSSIYNY